MTGASDLDGLIERAEALAQDARVLIALAGPPGAGKSSLSETLRRRFDAGRAARAGIVGMDGFHLDDGVLDRRGWRARKGAPHTFDVAGLEALLARLRAEPETEIFVPVFDRAAERSRAAAQAIGPQDRIVIVEGNYLLLDRPGWRRLRPHFDLTAMIEVPEAELRRRLEARWRGFGLSDAAIAEKLEGNDLPNGRLVMAESAPADFRLRF